MAFGGFDEAHRSPSGRGGQAPLAEINMTPLIDVMLVLLVVFIIAAPLFARAIAMDLPKEPGPARAAVANTSIALAIDRNGRYFWNGKPIDASQLNDRLAQAAALKPQPELALSADEGTAYRQIAAVMAAAQRAGVVKLGFVVGR